jgi:OOP family OmpA-OmpF porin
MNRSLSTLNFFKKGGEFMKFKLLAILVVLGMIVPGVLSAAEIITEEDIVKKTVTEDQFVKTADNFIVLFDASESMNVPYKKGGTESKYDLAKKILSDGNKQLPNLGYNGGFYSFSPFKELYPMGSWDKAKFAAAIDSLPPKGSGPTLLPEALRKIEPALQGLSGKTSVFIFSDGTYSQLGESKQPEDYTQQFADKYNVCFYIIGDASSNQAKKRLVDMAKANACSRVISFAQFVENPNYITGALYVVKATEKVVTSTETRIKGLKVSNVLFDFNKSDVKPQYDADLNQLGDFLKKNPKAYTLLVGYTDNIGSDEYNLGLSNRRADSVADYLMKNLGITRDQIVVNWYGEANPVASNDTEAGRAQNRRVEIAVGGM